MVHFTVVVFQFIHHQMNPGEVEVIFWLTLLSRWSCVECDEIKFVISTLAVGMQRKGTLSNMNHDIRTKHNSTVQYMILRVCLVAGLAGQRNSVGSRSAGGAFRVQRTQRPAVLPEATPNQRPASARPPGFAGVWVIVYLRHFIVAALYVLNPPGTP